jgi:hypothetical protein
MSHLHHQGRMERPTGKPQLPAFCRTRRQQPTPVPLWRLRRLEWLLWLVLTLQLSTLLLVVSLLPAPAPVSASPTAAPKQEQRLP